MRNEHKPFPIDARTPEGREEIAASHGWHAAWRTCIAVIEEKVAASASPWARDPRHVLQIELAAARKELDSLTPVKEEAAPTNRVVSLLRSWLEENYNDGAHWVYETFDDQQLLDEFAACDGNLADTKHSLRKHWEIVDAHAADIRAA